MSATVQISKQELLADSYQWLHDCGGQMAIANNPMASQLIKAGLARRGGFNHLGQRMLIALGPPPRKKVPVKQLADFCLHLPDCTTAEATTVANEIFDMCSGLPDSRDKHGPLKHGPLMGDWHDFMHWIPYIVGWDGKSYDNKMEEGGCILMAPPTWVYLAQRYINVGFMTRDPYILSGITGQINKTPVLLNKNLPTKRVVVINRDFTWKTTFNSKEEPTP